jgi:lipopolysaccharide/colanic/teichoic acid biosynthesis glycosyltransferase
VRKWFDGAGWFVGLAVTLFVLALLAVLLGLQSQNSVLWTGQRVTGTEQRGIVYYRWQGQSYSLDASGFGSSKAV